MRLVGFQNSALNVFFVWSLMFLLMGLGDVFDGAAFGEERIGDEKTVVISKQDSGKQIDVKTGDVIQIELEAMGTAGYQWFVESLDREILKFVSEETRIMQPGRLGAPVLMIWKFEVIKEGITEIRMDHYRSWEGKEQSTDYFEVRLNIRR